MEEKINHREIIKKIAENYSQLESSIVSQLRLSCDHHYVTIGSFREEIWQSLFEQIIPKKFSIERSVFIIDSNEKVSKEVDLVIFDEQYTPYIFNFGKIKYIPIEAVAVVVQCKSDHLGNQNITAWKDSITKLRTSLHSIARMHGKVAHGEIIDTVKYTQTSTRPIYILCHLNESATDRKVVMQHFDIVICPENGRLKMTTQSDKLSNWYKKLNHAEEQYKDNVMEMEGSFSDITLDQYKVGCWEETTNANEEESKVSDNKVVVGERTILSLIFQLNQLLMLINNPLLFPHQAYVKMFNRCLNEAEVESIPQSTII